MVQSSPDASPVKWHLAHTSWFFETFVLSPYVRRLHGLPSRTFTGSSTPITPRSATCRPRICAARSPRPPLDQPSSRIRVYVDRAIEALLARDLGSPMRRTTSSAVSSLGLEHEQQHLELIATDIKHALFTNPLHPAYQRSQPRAKPLRATAAGAQTGLHQHFPQVGLPRSGSHPLRVRSRSFCLRQRNPAPHGLSSSRSPWPIAWSPAREYFVLYRRQRLHPSRALALRRLVHHAPRRLAGPALLAARRGLPNPAGAFLRCMASARSTTCSKRPSATSASSRPTPSPAGPAMRLPTEFEWEHAAPRSGHAGPGQYARVRHACTPATRQPHPVRHAPATMFRRRLGVDAVFRLHRLPRLQNRCPARSASTTASS